MRTMAALRLAREEAQKNAQSAKAVLARGKAEAASKKRRQAVADDPPPPREEKKAGPPPPAHELPFRRQHGGYIPLKRLPADASFPPSKDVWEMEAIAKQVQAENEKYRLALARSVPREAAPIKKWQERRAFLREAERARAAREVAAAERLREAIAQPRLMPRREEEVDVIALMRKTALNSRVNGLADILIHRQQQQAAVAPDPLRAAAKRFKIAVDESDEILRFSAPEGKAEQEKNEAVIRVERKEADRLQKAADAAASPGLLRSLWKRVSSLWTGAKPFGGPAVDEEEDHERKVDALAQQLAAFNAEMDAVQKEREYDLRQVPGAELLVARVHAAAQMDIPRARQYQAVVRQDWHVFSKDVYSELVPYDLLANIMQQPLVDPARVEKAANAAFERVCTMLDAKGNTLPEHKNSDWEITNSLQLCAMTTPAAMSVRARQNMFKELDSLEAYAKHAHPEMSQKERGGWVHNQIASAKKGTLLWEVELQMRNVAWVDRARFMQEQFMKMNPNTPPSLVSIVNEACRTYAVSEYAHKQPAAAAAAVPGRPTGAPGVPPMPERAAAARDGKKDEEVLVADVQKQRDQEEAAAQKKHDGGPRGLEDGPFGGGYDGMLAMLAALPPVPDVVVAPARDVMKEEKAPRGRGIAGFPYARREAELVIGDVPDARREALRAALDEAHERTGGDAAATKRWIGRWAWRTVMAVNLERLEWKRDALRNAEPDPNNPVERMYRAEWALLHPLIEQGEAVGMWDHKLKEEDDHLAGQQRRARIAEDNIRQAEELRGERYWLPVDAAALDAERKEVRDRYQNGGDYPEMATDARRGGRLTGAPGVPPAPERQAAAIRDAEKEERLLAAAVQKQREAERLNDGRFAIAAMDVERAADDEEEKALAAQERQWLAPVAPEMFHQQPHLDQAEELRRFMQADREFNERVAQQQVALDRDRAELDAIYAGFNAAAAEDAPWWREFEEHRRREAAAEKNPDKKGGDEPFSGAPSRSLAAPVPVWSDNEIRDMYTYLLEKHGEQKLTNDVLRAYFKSALGDPAGRLYAANHANVTRVMRSLLEDEEDAALIARAGPRVYGKDHDGKTVEVRAGDYLAVRLEDNITTGYSWTLAALDGPLLLVKRAFVLSADAKRGLCGAGGDMVVIMRAGKTPGTAQFHAVYERTWSKTDEKFPFSLHVTVLPALLTGLRSSIPAFVFKNEEEEAPVDYQKEVETHQNEMDAWKDQAAEFHDLGEPRLLDMPRLQQAFAPGSFETGLGFDDQPLLFPDAAAQEAKASAPAPTPTPAPAPAPAPARRQPTTKTPADVVAYVSASAATAAFMLAEAKSQAAALDIKEQLARGRQWQEAQRRARNTAAMAALRRRQIMEKREMQRQAAAQRLRSGKEPPPPSPPLPRPVMATIAPFPEPMIVPGVQFSTPPRLQQLPPPPPLVSDLQELRHRAQQQQQQQKQQQIPPPPPPSIEWKCYKTASTEYLVNNTLVNLLGRKKIIGPNITSKILQSPSNTIAFKDGVPRSRVYICSTKDPEEARAILVFRKVHTIAADKRDLSYTSITAVLADEKAEFDMLKTALDAFIRQNRPHEVMVLSATTDDHLTATQLAAVGFKHHPQQASIDRAHNRTTWIRIPSAQ